MFFKRFLFTIQVFIIPAASEASEETMIIDFHTHTFPDKIAGKAITKLSHASHSVPFTDGTVDGLRKSMERSGIDKSIVLPVATSPRQVEHINDSSIRINETEQNIISFGAMHPDYENYREELKRIKDHKIKGIKIHPVYQGVDLDDIRYLRILECCAELDLIVVTHAGLDIGFPGVVHCSPSMAAHVISEIGPFKFVLAHMGGWKNWDEVPSLLASSGVMIDTSFSTGSFVPLKDGYWNAKDTRMLNEEQTVSLIRAFGADHVLFGTDSPWSDQRKSLDFIRNLSLTQTEKDLILGGNAKKLLS